MAEIKPVGVVKNWGILIVIAAAIDVVQFIIDFTGFGELANKVIDPFIGFAFYGYIKFFKGEQLTTTQTASLILTFFIEEAPIPFIEVAPAWAFDIWYIAQSSEKRKMAENSIAEEQNTEENNSQNDQIIKRRQLYFNNQGISTDEESQGS